MEGQRIYVKNLNFTAFEDVDVRNPTRRCLRFCGFLGSTRAGDKSTTIGSMLICFGKNLASEGKRAFSGMI